MELRQLEHFLAVAEEGSFTAAASRLYLVQSSLSASLLSLERSLGTDLFIRGRRGAELTDAGRAVLEPARAALGALQGVRDAVAEVTGLLRGTVRIATTSVPLPPRISLCETIRWFSEAHPGLQVQVTHADSRTMIEKVADGQVDFAITPRTDDMPTRLRFQPLISSQLALFCPAGHRLAGAREVCPRDLLDEPIIDLPRGWMSRTLFDSLLSEHEPPRHRRLEASDWASSLALAQRGVGIAYGPKDAVDLAAYRGLAGATLAAAPRWELGVATRDEALRGAAGRAFLSRYLDLCDGCGNG